MSRAEDYIRDNTKALKESNGKEYFMWISPDQARTAVEIAREEIIEKVVHHIIHNTKTVHYNDYDTREFNKSSLDDIINDLKQAMKDEL